MIELIIRRVIESYYGIEMDLQRARMAKKLSEWSELQHKAETRKARKTRKVRYITKENEMYTGLAENIAIADRVDIDGDVMIFVQGGEGFIRKEDAPAIIAHLTQLFGLDKELNNAI